MQLLLRNASGDDMWHYTLERDYTAENGGTAPDLCLMFSSPLLQVGSAYRLIDETTGNMLGKVDALESPYSNMKVRTTGIEDVLTDQSADNTFYDLSGRRVAQPAKGIYIKNGKKIVF